MNAGSGKKLDWFWKRWFFDGGYPDLAIGTVTKKLKAYTIKIVSKGSKPVPIDLLISFADKTTMQVHRSISVWEKGNTEVSITVPTPKKIEEISLGSTYVPDVNKEDNIYRARAQPNL